MTEFMCKHCGYIGIKHSNGLCSGWCAKCQRNDKLVEIDNSKPEIIEEEPEDIAVTLVIAVIILAVSIGASLIGVSLALA